MNVRRQTDIHRQRSKCKTGFEPLQELSCFMLDTCVAHQKNIHCLGNNMNCKVIFKCKWQIFFIVFHLLAISKKISKKNKQIFSQISVCYPSFKPDGSSSVWRDSFNNNSWCFNSPFTFSITWAWIALCFVIISCSMHETTVHLRWPEASACLRSFSLHLFHQCN